MGPPYTIYNKFAQLGTPGATGGGGAAQIFLMLDENPCGINDGFFMDTPNDTGWIDCPASYHGGAGGISFCDGHAIIRQWRDPVVLNWTYEFHGRVVQGTLTPDLRWFRALTTVSNASN